MNTTSITRITRTIILGVLLFLTACSPSAIGFPLIVPATTPLATPLQSTSREAQVESVEIQFLEADPVQINAIVRGNLTEACAKLGDTQVRYATNTFMITLFAVSPSDRGCAQITTPFEQTIPLSTTGLPSGEYTVKANGVSAVFALPADVTPTVVPTTSDGTGQTKTYTSSLYGYRVSYPADWTIQVNTSVPSGAGSNPEYVTLMTNDGSNLPRIDIEVLTDVPPMLGFEGCVKNFVFRTLPACKISLPAGQNPASEIWVFQNGAANFFIGMQYQDAKSLQLFNDFITSFVFTQ